MFQLIGGIVGSVYMLIGVVWTVFAYKAGKKWGFHDFTAYWQMFLLFPLWLPWMILMRYSEVPETLENIPD